MSLEKTEEIWTSQSVTTSLRFLGDSSLSRLQSPPCGAGWMLELARKKVMGSNKKRSSKLLFMPQTSQPEWEGTVINVQVNITGSHTDGSDEQRTISDPFSTVCDLQVMLARNTTGVLLWSDTSLRPFLNANIVLKVDIVKCTAPGNLLRLSSPPGSYAENSQSTSPHLPADTLRSRAVLRILDESLSTGISFDTKFLVNSRRSDSGRVLKPLPVYAHSDVLLEACPRLESLFPSGLTLIEDDFPLTALHDYDYDVDSDLDEDECGVDVTSQPVTTPDLMEDSVLHAMDEVSVGAEFEKVLIAANGQPTTPHSPSTHSPEESVMQHEGVDKLVQVKCAAHRTWKAFVYYCYTGKVVFSPLKSQKPQSRVSQEAVPTCSPKSMYRLADKLCMESLKKEALEAVRSRLSASNIVKETFSSFTSRFPEIRDMELAMLVASRTHPEVQQELDMKIEELATGKIPYSVTALTALMRLLSM